MQSGNHKDDAFSTIAKSLSEEESTRIKSLKGQWTQDTFCQLLFNSVKYAHSLGIYLIEWLDFQKHYQKHCNNHTHSTLNTHMDYSFFFSVLLLR